MINVDKPTSSIANTSRAASGETWATITSTWASETRTWAELISRMFNITRQSSSMTNIAKPA